MAECLSVRAPLQVRPDLLITQHNPPCELVPTTVVGIPQGGRVLGAWYAATVLRNGLEVGSVLDARAVNLDRIFRLMRILDLDLHLQHKQPAGQGSVAAQPRRSAQQNSSVDSSRATPLCVVPCPSVQ